MRTLDATLIAVGLLAGDECSLTALVHPFDHREHRQRSKRKKV